MSKNFDKPIPYIKEWNSKQSKRGGIKVMPMEFSGDLYGIEIRFPNGKCHCERDVFPDIKAAVAWRSGGVLTISSSWEDFESGVISCYVACTDPAYDDGNIVGTLRVILGEIIPGFFIKQGSTLD